MLQRLQAQSVSHLLMLVTVILTVLPILLLAVYLYDTTWDDRWREIREKHQLLAQNMAAPISTYVNDHRNMLALLSESVAIIQSDNKSQLQKIITQSQRNLHGFRSLALIDVQGKVLSLAENGRSSIPDKDDLSHEQCYIKTRKTGKWSISKVKRNPFTGIPTIYMAQPVIDKHGMLSSIILGELRLDYIEQLRRQIRFGERGHSAIVDQAGQVIAHPNPQWMREMKDLSNLPIVKLMLQGKTGVTEFYSPFIRENMVAGYAVVPEIGWGIMVPQPASEVSAQVNAIMRSYIAWALVGVILAGILAVIIARWIIQPMNKLAADSHLIIHNGLQGNLPAVNANAPREIRQLGSALHTLIAELQCSRHEVTQLNASLQQRVDDATLRLRESNARLEQVARSDHLTALANRRHFEKLLSNALCRRSSDTDYLCVLLIDIDHFKQINDAYGHAVGDTVLNHVARILENAMRPDDMVARYGGDEFVAYLRCSHATGRQRASQIRDAIERYAVTWQGKSIHITASIGLYHQKLGEGVDVGELLHNADYAMYQAKKQGRNRVVDISH